MKKIRTIYVDSEAWEKFKQFCKSQGIPMSFVFNKIIENINFQIDQKNINVNVNINLIPVQQKTIINNNSNNHQLLKQLHEKELAEWLNIAEEAIRQNRPIPFRAKEKIKKLLNKVDLSPEQCEKIQKIIFT